MKKLLTNSWVVSLLIFVAIFFVTVGLSFGFDAGMASGPIAFIFLAGAMILSLVAGIILTLQKRGMLSKVFLLIPFWFVVLFIVLMII